MRTFTRIALLGVTVPMLAALPATTAVAAPTNAPYSFPGTADCGPDGTFDVRGEHGTIGGQHLEPRLRDQKRWHDCAVHPRQPRPDVHLPRGH